jgi:hypothetical protein
VATLFLFCAAIWLFFAPWFNLVLVQVTPFGMISSTLQALVTAAKHSPDYAKQIARGAPTDTPSEPSPRLGDVLKGVGGLMLFGSAFVYGGGLAVGVFGGFRILSRWCSRLSIAGFVISLGGCLLGLLGWNLLFAGETEEIVKAVMSAANVGLTSYFYFALFTSAMGTITSVVACR